ncbi:MAG: hypothetical protein AAF620_00240 [Bacteroidota bacterium]
MNRNDILIAIASSDDLTVVNSNNPFFHTSNYEGDENGFPVLGVELTSTGSNVLSFQAGLVMDDFVQIPESNITDTPFLIYVYHVDNLGIRTETPKFFAVDEKQRLITPFNVRGIDDFGYNIVFDGSVYQSYLGNRGGFTLRTYEIGDFSIDDSIEQNEKMLLLANKGNLLNDPTKGVEILREINGVSNIQELENRIRKEWAKDELKVDRISITEDGRISVDSSELFEDK